MSDILKHIVVGDMLGSFAGESEKSWLNSMGSVFALGVASHAVMDLAEPDFTVNWFDMPALKMATPFLLFQIFGIYFVFKMIRKQTRRRPRSLKLRLAAIAGAVAPDIIDGIYAVVHPQAWYTGQLLFPWHQLRWQINLMSMWSTLSMTAVLMLMRYLSLPVYHWLCPRPFVDEGEESLYLQSGEIFGAEGEEEA